MWEGSLSTHELKLIARIQSEDVSFPLDQNLVFTDKLRPCALFVGLETLPRFSITVLETGDLHHRTEWLTFLTFIWNHSRVGVIHASGKELLVQVDRHPREGSPNYATVLYAPLPPGIARRPRPGEAMPLGASGAGASAPAPAALPGPSAGQTVAPGQMHPQYLETVAHGHSTWAFGALAELVDNAKDAGASRVEISIVYGEAPHSQPTANDPSSSTRPGSGASASTAKQSAGTGASIAGAGVEHRTGRSAVPMLCVSDNGCGMQYREVVEMLSLGHAPPPAEAVHRIGRFGVGFKSGTMRLGKDVVVLTQCAESRTIALLSRTLNQGKQFVDMPIVTWRKKEGGGMEVDTSVCSAEEEVQRMQLIRSVTPFDSFRVAEEFLRLEEMARPSGGEGGGNDESLSDGGSGVESSLMDVKVEVKKEAEEEEAAGPPRKKQRKNAPPTGTRIFVLNLSRKEGNWELDWDSDPHNILIRSRRARTRINQLASDVPLDYDLRVYLNYLFTPVEGAASNMSMFVQGQQVEVRSLMHGLTKVVRYKNNARNWVIRLGFSAAEQEAGRCGVFLYWRGRLIEAYKRVGCMQYGNDSGLGVLGIMDTSPVMEGIPGSGVNNNKQEFLDTPEYQGLLEWIKEKVDKYWDDHFDHDAQGVADRAAMDGPVDPVSEWVQCESCKKWRRWPEGVPVPQQNEHWFCYQAPLQISCDVPQEQEEDGEFTANINRDGQMRGHALPGRGRGSRRAPRA